MPLLLAAALAVQVAAVQAQPAQGPGAQRQLRADPPQPAAAPFGYPGVPAGGTRRVIIVDPQQTPLGQMPRSLPGPAGSPSSVHSIQPLAEPAARMQRDADPRDASARALRAEQPATSANLPGYPAHNPGRHVIIIGPASTQSFAGTGDRTPPAAGSVSLDPPARIQR